MIALTTRDGICRAQTNKENLVWLISTQQASDQRLLTQTMNQRVRCPNYWEILLVVVALPHTSKVGNNNNKSVIIGEILKNDKTYFLVFSFTVTAS